MAVLPTEAGTRARAMLQPSVGEKEPLVMILLRLPLVIGETHRQAVTQHPFFCEDESYQLFGIAFTLQFQRFPADEIAVSRFPADRPAHVGSQR